ncbi:MAG: hypothetical protein ACRD34_09150 [Bryobacteraceae bacterium]
MSDAPQKIRAGAATDEAPIGRERSLNNLRPPWPKGVSGNPSGRAKHKRGVWIKVTSVESLIQVVLALIESEED